MFEGKTASKISQVTNTKATEVVEAAEGVDVQIDWIDKEIGGIIKAEDHHGLLTMPVK